MIKWLSRYHIISHLLYSGNRPTTPGDDRLILMYPLTPEGMQSILMNHIVLHVQEFFFCYFALQNGKDMQYVVQIVQCTYSITTISFIVYKRMFKVYQMYRDEDPKQNFPWFGSGSVEIKNRVRLRIRPLFEIKNMSKKSWSIFHT